MTTHDFENFEVKSFGPDEVLAAMLDEMHCGSCLMPLPQEFLDYLKSQGDDDPETSMDFFYTQFKMMDGKTHITLLTMMEVMQLHAATHEYIKGTLEAIADQVDDAEG